MCLIALRQLGWAGPKDLGCICPKRKPLMVPLIHWMIMDYELHGFLLCWILSFYFFLSFSLVLVSALSLIFALSINSMCFIGMKYSVILANHSINYSILSSLSLCSVWGLPSCWGPLLAPRSSSSCSWSTWRPPPPPPPPTPPSWSWLLCWGAAPGTSWNHTSRRSLIRWSNQTSAKSTSRWVYDPWPMDMTYGYDLWVGNWGKR